MPALWRGLDLSVLTGISGPKTWIMFKSTFFLFQGYPFCRRKWLGGYAFPDGKSGAV